MAKLTPEEKQARLDLKPTLKFLTNHEVKTLGDIIFKLFFVLGTQLMIIKSQKPQYSGQSRSIDDCYILAKHYFHNITYKQVSDAVEFFYEEKEDNKGHRLSHWWCYTVNRRVHRSFGYPTKERINELLDLRKLNYR